MEPALTRLDRAIEFAVLASAGGEQQKGKLYRRLAAALATQGRVNSEDAIFGLPNFARLAPVLPVLSTDQDGGRRVHRVWTDRRAFAPAVAALAVLFDRSLCPEGDSMFTLGVSPDAQALYGYRLGTLEVRAYRYDRDGQRNEADPDDETWTRASILLSGAALAFFKDLDLMRFAPMFLRRVAEGDLPSGTLPPQPKGRRSPFIHIPKLNS